MGLLNILKVCTSRSWGGMEMHAVILADKLKDRGHRVFPVCSEGSRIHQDLLGRGFRPYLISGKGYLNSGAIRLLAWILNKNPIHLIHCDYSKDLWSIVPALYFSRQVPIVLIKHIGTQKPKKDPLHRWIYKHVDVVVAISRVIQQNLLATHSLSPEKVEVIHHGVDLSRFNPEKMAGTGVRRELGVALDDVVVGIVGRLQVGKGYLEFLQMAQGVLQVYQNVKFLIVGEATRGEEREAEMILSRISASGLQDKVICTGFRPDVPRLLSAMDIFAFPSRAEAFGLVLIEAMAMGLPVVACNSDGVLDIVRHGETGFLVPPKDVEKLTEAVLRLIRNPTLRISFGQAGRKLAREKFSEQRMINQMEELYYRILSAGSESHCKGSLNLQSETAVG